MNGETAFVCFMAAIGTINLVFMVRMELRDRARRRMLFEHRGATDEQREAMTREVFRTGDAHVWSDGKMKRIPRESSK